METNKNKLIELLSNELYDLQDILLVVYNANPYDDLIEEAYFKTRAILERIEYGDE